MSLVAQAPKGQAPVIRLWHVHQHATKHRQRASLAYEQMACFRTVVRIGTHCHCHRDTGISQPRMSEQLPHDAGMCLAVNMEAACPWSTENIVAVQKQTCRESHHSQRDAMLREGQHACLRSSRHMRRGKTDVRPIWRQRARSGSCQARSLAPHPVAQQGRP